jgi:hypothetical protein
MIFNPSWTRLPIASTANLAVLPEPRPTIIPLCNPHGRQLDLGNGRLEQLAQVFGYPIIWHAFEISAKLHFDDG